MARADPTGTAPVMGRWGVARRDRALAIAGGRPLVTADPASVSWLTGLAVEIEWGPNPFAVPPVALLEPIELV